MKNAKSTNPAKHKGGPFRHLILGKGRYVSPIREIWCWNRV